MKLIKASFLIKEQEENLEGVYKQIEWAGRHCYKSEDKITPDSAQEFVERMIKSGHCAMLEHGTVYLTHPIENIAKPDYKGIGNKYRENKYSKVVSDNWGTKYITTNYRVLIENGWLDDLQFICEPTEFHAKRTTVKFICDRGVSHEFVRHRVFSFAQESTRYCNYSKDKFDNEITFIIPLWFDKDNITTDLKYPIHSIESKSKYASVLYEKEIEKIDENTNERTPWSAEDWYIHSLRLSELAYIKALEQGWVAQQARAVLPNSLKTELIMTGFDSDWEHFFDLRTPPPAHPQARELSIPLELEFIKLGKV